MTPSFDTIIIGAGCNGLAAALRLARAGKSVLVLERAPDVGGQSRVEEFAPGFRSSLRVFDSGWLSPLVRREMPTPPAMRDNSWAFSGVDDSGVIHAVPREGAGAAAVLRRFGESDARRWAEFTSLCERLSAVLGKLYQLPAPQIDNLSAKEIFPFLKIAAGVRFSDAALIHDLLRILPLPVADLAEDFFGSDLLRSAVAAAGVQGLRQGPMSGGTSFLLLHSVVGASHGALRYRPYPESGPDGFAKHLAEAARARGVVIRCDSDVAAIVVSNFAVTGVRLEDGTEIRCRSVISTADPVQTMLGMVDANWLDPDLIHAISNVKFRGSTTHIRFALEGLPTDGGEVGARAVGLDGVVNLSATVASIERAADFAKYEAVSEQPHIEFTIPSLRWPQLAPAGQHVLEARVAFAPFRVREGDWTATRKEALAERVLRRLNEVLPGIRDRVRHHEVLSPVEMQQRHALTEGALSHGEMMLDQILFMRPVAQLSRYATPVDGLFLGGSGSHPGPLLPGSAGILAAERRLADN